MKTYWNGKRVRDKKGRFAKYNKWILPFISLVFAIGLITMVDNTIVYEAVAPTEVLAEQPKLEATVQELKENVKDKIRSVESGGISVDDGELFVTFDPHSGIKDECRRIGGKMNIECLSVGEYQWKVGTLQKDYKALYGEDLTQLEALELALDTERAGEVFIETVLNIEGSIWQWSAAQKDPEYFKTIIPIIRKLNDSTN